MTRVGITKHVRIKLQPANSESDRLGAPFEVGLAPERGPASVTEVLAPESREGQSMKMIDDCLASVYEPTAPEAPAVAEFPVLGRAERETGVETPTVRKRSAGTQRLSEVKKAPGTSSFLK
jgi:hypothetical protein